MAGSALLEDHRASGDLLEDIGRVALESLQRSTREREYALDPVAWIRDVLGDDIWSLQEVICESVRDHRYTAIRACHGPGKSFIAARLAAWWIATHPIGEAFVVTTAPTWDQVNSVLWRELRRAKRAGELPGNITLNARWNVGEEIIAVGRKPADYNEVAFQGIHERYLLAIIDEAAGISEQLFDAVESLVTNEDCRVLAIGNPDDPESYFAKVCQSGSGWNEIGISAFDTPNFTGEEVPERVSKLLVSKLWVEERRKRWGEGTPIWISKVLGQFPEISEDTLITPAMIRNGELKELPDAGDRTYSVDIARFGSDETVMYENRGGRIRKVWSFRKKSTMETAGKIVAHWRKYPGRLVIDGVGVGGGVVDRIRELNIPVIEYNGGESSSDKDFVNLRAESWWKVRTALEQNEIDLDPHDDELLAQLGKQKYELTSKGKLFLPPKKTVSDPSPDRGDAVAMILRYNQAEMRSKKSNKKHWLKDAKF